MEDPKVFVCQGPPACKLNGDDAVRQQEKGCPWCKRIRVHADGTETVSEPGSGLFFHSTPSPDACDHDFQGWRDFEDGTGGEQVCAKCGMGAMHYSLMVGP
jgi:hypothetical protein